MERGGSGGSGAFVDIADKEVGEAPLAVDVVTALPVVVMIPVDVAIVPTDAVPPSLPPSLIPPALAFNQINFYHVVY